MKMRRARLIVNARVRARPRRRYFMSIFNRRISRAVVGKTRLTKITPVWGRVRTAGIIVWQSEIEPVRKVAV